MNYRVQGGMPLSGSVATNISKNASVAMLAGSLLNRGTTTLKNMPRIEEVNRLVEVLESIGVSVEWKESGLPAATGLSERSSRSGAAQAGDMVIAPPYELDLKNINKESARRTRSIALFIGPITHWLDEFELPMPGGCNLGDRSMAAHVYALAKMGIKVGEGEGGMFRVDARDKHAADIVMLEASDTGTENVLLAAAKLPGKTTIRFASVNYMVQDVCVFLEQLGVRVEGIGTHELVVHGAPDIDDDIDGYPSEDPVEAMFFLSLAATTHSAITIERAPIDFLELELITLENMGLQYERGDTYTAANGHTRLVDIHTKPSEFTAPLEKIAPRPYPGINIDNLPFFVPVATQAKGRTLIHDWVYENRAPYYMEINKLGGDLVLADVHRVFVNGPTELQPAEVVCPPALRPATLLLIGMLAAKGESTLYNVYPINRGYENLHSRLAGLGAKIDALG